MALPQPTNQPTNQPTTQGRRKASPNHTHTAQRVTHFTFSCVRVKIIFFGKKSAYPQLFFAGDTAVYPKKLKTKN
jgi:hypothetical protein